MEPIKPELLPPTLTRKMTRTEHLEWCKRRALQYVEDGNLDDAYTSMASDLRKHPELKDHPAIGLGLQMMMSGLLSTPGEMRRFILGFN